MRFYAITYTQQEQYYINEFRQAFRPAWYVLKEGAATRKEAGDLEQIRTAIGTDSIRETEIKNMKVITEKQYNKMFGDY